MGMRIYVHVKKDPFFKVDTTCNGITNRHGTLCVVNCEGPFDPDENCPAVMLVDDRPMGTPYPKLVPVDEYKKGTWLMFGGNYAGCCDDRFTHLCEKAEGGPYGMLPVFDRIEN